LPTGWADPPSAMGGSSRCTGSRPVLVRQGEHGRANTEGKFNVAIGGRYALEGGRQCEPVELSLAVAAGGFRSPTAGRYSNHDSGLIRAQIAHVVSSVNHTERAITRTPGPKCKAIYRFLSSLLPFGLQLGLASAPEDATIECGPGYAASCRFIFRLPGTARSSRSLVRSRHRRVGGFLLGHHGAVTD
jgi:hypothetical protein